MYQCSNDYVLQNKQFTISQSASCNNSAQIFKSSQHKFSVVDLSGCRGLTAFMKTEQCFLLLPLSFRTSRTAYFLGTTFTSSKGHLLILHWSLKKKKKRRLVNEDGNFEPLHLSLKKNSIYPTLLCESLVCIKVAARKPVIFHVLQQILTPFFHTIDLLCLAICLWVKYCKHISFSFDFA